MKGKKNILTRPKTTEGKKTNIDREITGKKKLKRSKREKKNVLKGKKESPLYKSGKEK